MKTPKAMILAAGRGTRLRPLTDETPKPLLLLGGKPLIAYHLETFAKVGIQDVVINVSYHAEKIQSTLGSGKQYGVQIHYSVEPETGGLETGGGIFNALSLLGKDPFIVVNGDIWTDYPFAELFELIDTLWPADNFARPRQKTLIDEHRGAINQRFLASYSGNYLGHLVLVNNPAHCPSGDFNLQNKNITSHELNRLTFSGIGIYHPAIFDGCTAGAFPLLPILKKAIAAQKISGEHYCGNWIDVGTISRLNEAEALLAKKIT